MNPALAAALDESRQGDYTDLPDCIKAYVTPMQWAYMTDTQKADLIRAETEPDFP